MPAGVRRSGTRWRTWTTAIVLIAAPFVGEGGWSADGFEVKSDIGARLPPGVPVHVFHGLQDKTAPPSHAGLYALAIPQARVHQLAERDHQLNNDLSEVAEVIRLSAPGVLSRPSSSRAPAAGRR
jgi:pimeloyl-ACP methyl ester carboxylesterase